MRKHALMAAPLLVSFALAACGQQNREMQHATINGVDIAYEVVGDGEPVLLISNLVADLYVPLFDQPALESYQLINYHQRGSGESRGYVGPYNYQVHAQDALALLDHLGIEEAHVVSHSAGGLIGLYLGMIAPDRVHSQVSLEGIMPETEEFVLLFNRQGGPDLSVSTPPEERANTLLTGMFGPDWADLLSPIYPNIAEHLSRFYANMTGQEMTFVTESEYTKLDMPVLRVLSGDESPPHLLITEALRERLSDYEVVTLPGTKHVLPLLWPTPVAEAMASFFREHPIQ